MADIPDFSVKQNFPIAAVLAAYQNRDNMALKQQELQQQQLTNTIGAIGQIGKSLQDRKRSIAQAMTMGQQFGMSPQEVEGLTPEQVIEVQKQKSGNTNLGQAMLLQKVITDPKALDNPAVQALAQNLFKSQAPTAATQTPIPSNGGGFFKNFKSALGFNPTPTNTGMTPDGSSAIAPSGGTPPPTVSSGTVTGMGGTPPPTPPPSGGIDLSKLTAGKGTTALAVKLAAQNGEKNIYQYDGNGKLSKVGAVEKGSQIMPPKREPLPMDQGKAEFLILDRFDNNPQVRKQQQSLDGASAVRDLANSGNPIAAAAIPTYMARASGEVGNLSEADKAPFGGSRAILTRMEAALKQSVDGTLTPDNKKFLIQLADVMESSAEKNLDRHARDIARQYSKPGNMLPKEAFGMLRPGRTYDEQKTTEGPESKDVLKIGGTFHGQKITGVKLKKQ